MTDGSSIGTESENPFIGPRPFMQGEQLFGRDRETREVRDVLIAERVVLLHSPSGAGKSSLLEASLRAELEEAGFFIPPTIRVGYESLHISASPANRYILSTINSLEDQSIDNQVISVDVRDSPSLVEYVNQLKARQRTDTDLCLFFDQFEEVLTLDLLDKERKDEFFAQLGNVLRDPSIWVLFAMREDFIGELDPYLKHIPRRLSTRFRLDFLDREAATAAITGPAQQIGCRFSPAAVQYIIEDLSRVRVNRGGTSGLEVGPYVEPVQLQVVCRQLWQKVQVSERVIEEADVVGIVNADGALAEFYAEQIASISSQLNFSERRIREWINESLITPQGFRAQAYEFPSEQGSDILRALQNAYLIRGEKRRGITWYELNHDRLVAPIRDDNARWANNKLLPVQHRASEWYRQGRSPGLLITGDALKQAELWEAAEGSEVSDVERDFIKESRQKVETQSIEANQARRRSLAYLTLAIAAFLGMVASGVLFFESRTAREDAELARAEAEARDLAARSQTTLDPYAAVLLAMEAEFRTKEPLPEARRAWVNASKTLASLPVRLVAPVVKVTSSRPSESSWSPLGDLLAIADGSDFVTFVNRSGRIQGKVSVDHEVYSVKWSGDGSSLVASSNYGMTRIDADLSVVEQEIFDPSVWNDPPVISPANDRAVVSELVSNSYLDISLQDIGGNVISDLVDQSNCIQVSWDPTGAMFAAICEFDSVLFLINSDGQLVAKLGAEEMGKAFSGLFWNPEGSILAVVQSSNSFPPEREILFLSIDGEIIGRVALENRQSENDVYGYSSFIEWNGTGTKIVSGPPLQIIDVASLSTKQVDGILEEVSYSWGLSWSPTGRLLALVEGSEFQLLSETGGVVGDRFSLGTGTSGFRWTPDGEVVTTLNQDGTLTLIDESGKVIGESFSLSDDPIDLQQSPDGDLMSLLDADGTLRMFSLLQRSGPVFPNTETKGFTLLKWNPRLPILAAGSGSQGLLLLQDGELIENPLGVKSAGSEECSRYFCSITSIEWNKDGSLLLVGGQGGTGADYVVLNIRGEVVGTLVNPVRGGQIAPASWAPNDNRIVASSSTEGLVVFDSTGKRSKLDLPDALRWGGSAEWSPSGSRISVINENGLFLGAWENPEESDNLKFREIKIEPSQSLKEVNLPLSAFWGMNSDTLTVIHPSSDETSELVLLDADGEEIRRLDEVSPSTSAVWSNQDVLLIPLTGGRFKLVRADGSDFGSEIKIEKCNSSAAFGFTNLVWSPSGNSFAIYCQDMLFIYSKETELLATFGGFIGRFLTASSWSPDESVIVDKNEDGLLQLFSPRGLVLTPPFGKKSDFGIAVWDPSGKIVIRADEFFDWEVYYGWSEADACHHLEDVFQLVETKDIVGISGYTPVCGSGKKIPELAVLPTSRFPFDFG